jgi:glutaconate CoA-transferase subunit B
VVIVPHDRRTFVPRLDFLTTVGHGYGPGSRASLGLHGRGPAAVITQLCALEPDPSTLELTLTQLHPAVTVEQVRSATGWELAVAKELRATEPATDEELDALRELIGR